MDRFTSQEQPNADAMTEWRQFLHAHAEVGHDLFETSAYVADRLEEMGLAVTRNVGGTGVVARIELGEPGKGRQLGLRADMDALPMQEHTGLPHASQNPGAMHACGHDGHTAMLLGAADLIQRRIRSGQITGDGAITFIFQPAEEVGGDDSGAQRMIRDGLFDRFPMDEVYGLHNAPLDEEGTMQFRHGPLLCSSERVEITIYGKQSHGATLHLAKDATLAMASMIMSLNTLITQDTPPLETGIFNIGEAHSGTTYNVISAEAKIYGCLRAYRPEVIEMLRQRIKEIVEFSAKTYGCTAEVQIGPGYPAVINDDRALDHSIASAIRLLGEDRVEVEASQITAGEDFAFYLQHAPGAFATIGNGDNGWKNGEHIGPCAVHSPYFDFNDAILPTGASYWAALVEDRLKADA